MLILHARCIIMASLAEYVLLIVLIAVVCVTAVALLGKTASNAFYRVTCMTFNSINDCKKLCEAGEQDGCIRLCHLVPASCNQVTTTTTIRNTGATTREYCGDGVCSRDLNENARTCSQDC